LVAADGISNHRYLYNVSESFVRIPEWLNTTVLEVPRQWGA